MDRGDSALAESLGRRCSGGGESPCGIGVASWLDWPGAATGAASRSKRRLLTGPAFSFAAAFFAILAPVGQVGTMAAANSTTAAILVGGLMSITVSRLIARGKTLPPVAAYSWPNTAVHAVSVAVTLFAATGIVLAWDRTPVSAWLLVTIVVLSQPIDEVTVRRSVQRVLGTLAGAVIAGLIIVAVTYLVRQLVNRATPIGLNTTTESASFRETRAGLIVAGFKLKASPVQPAPPASPAGLETPTRKVALVSTCGGATTERRSSSGGGRCRSRPGERPTCSPGHGG